jgi:hypothetical protein
MTDLLHKQGNEKVTTTKQRRVVVTASAPPSEGPEFSS